MYAAKKIPAFRPGLYVDCLFLLGFGKYNPVYFGKKVIEEKVKEVAVCAFCIHYGVKYSYNATGSKFF